jgi:HEAT repeat protein
MSDTQRLLKQLRGAPARAKEAVERLAARGASVAPAVVEALRKSNPVEAANLQRVLLKMDDPGVVPLMLELLNDKNLTVQVTAFRALGALRDRRALKPLLSQLRKRGNSASARGWAADALGDLGDRRAVETLLAAAREVLDGEDFEDEANVFLAAVGALAKLGNQELAGEAISLAERGGGMARTGAVRLLKYLVGPGLFRALERNLRERDAEKRREAVEALFLLGLKESIAALVKRAGDRDQGVRALVVNRLRDLTGEEFEDDLTARRAAAWWKENHDSYKGGVTYRLGRPLRVADLVELLKGEPSWRDQIIDELLIITGEDFGVAGKHYAKEEKEFYPPVRRWWARQKPGRFEPGRLYKYGHEQDAHAVFEEGVSQSRKRSKR